ncbi:hypothetical protein P3W45_000724 [Vairimorpha bombi]
MPSSSEEEVLKRRRTNKPTIKKKDLRNLFDEESEESSLEYVPESTVQDNFFCELFEHVQRYSSDENVPRICELHSMGYNMHHIFLNETRSLDFYQFLDIYKHITGKIYNIDIFNIFFDRIYNGGLNMTHDDKLFSITKEKNMIKGVILDFYGNIIDRFSFLDNKILSYVEEINPKYIIISGYNNMVRSVVQLLIRYKVFYMECKYFSKMSIYDRLCHVGRLSIFPEVEFINLYKNIHLSNERISYNDVTYSDDLNNDVISDNIKISICTVISVTKINIKFLLQYEDKLKLLEFLGLGNCTRIFENDVYETEEDIKKVLKNEILFKNFMTYFTIDQKYGRPSFKGFPDSFVFKELINIKINSIQELLNKEVEGKIFFVDEFYVLVNILNNVTCYVRSTDKYYLNQMVKLRIIEINEPFLSFTGEIVSVNKPVQKIIKHPLLVNLNNKDAQNKLKESNEYFLLRQSTKDNKIIILLKLYQDIIVHIKLEDYDNLDESVNKKVKNVLRCVSLIKRHKYFYADEDEAMSKISVYCEYIKYGFYFSREYPGRLCFMYNNHGISKEYLSVDEKIMYKGREYENLDEFIKYRKGMYKNKDYLF